jgi:hypothetical protein
MSIAALTTSAAICGSSIRSFKKAAIEDKCSTCQMTKARLSAAEAARSPGYYQAVPNQPVVVAGATAREE